MDWHASHVQVRSFLIATAASTVDLHYLTLFAHNILYCFCEFTIVNAKFTIIAYQFTPRWSLKENLLVKIESSNVVLCGKSVTLSNLSGNGLKRSKGIFIFISTCRYSWKGQNNLKFLQLFWSILACTDFRIGSRWYFLYSTNSEK